MPPNNFPEKQGKASLSEGGGADAPEGVGIPAKRDTVKRLWDVSSSAHLKYAENRGTPGIPANQKPVTPRLLAFLM